MGVWCDICADGKFDRSERGMVRCQAKVASFSVGIDYQQGESDAVDGRQQMYAPRDADLLD